MTDAAPITKEERAAIFRVYECDRPARYFKDHKELNWYAIACDIEAALAAAEGENARLREVLDVPIVWSNEERDGLANTFKEASQKHGLYESLFAVAAWILRRRAKNGSKLKSRGFDKTLRKKFNGTVERKAE